MSQHDYSLANASGASFRSDLNDALGAIATNNSGTSEPGTTFAYQWWADTTNGLLKIRDAANAAWVTVGTLASTNLALAPLSAPNFTDKVYINDSANANMTIGLTINQGANDDEAIAIKSSDVAHGVTAQTETDTYAYLRKIFATTGGVELTGLAESAATAGLLLRGVSGTVTTKSTAVTGVVAIQGFLNDGTTGVAALGANTNILSVGAGSTTRFILDADGDSHQDVGTAWTNFDTVDDVMMLNALAWNLMNKPDDPVRGVLGEWLAQHRSTLERLNIVTFNKNGHHFCNMSKLTMLLVGAVRQMAREVLFRSGEAKGLAADIKTMKGQIEGLLAALPKPQ